MKPIQFFHLKDMLHINCYDFFIMNEDRNFFACVCRNENQSLVEIDICFVLSVFMCLPASPWLKSSRSERYLREMLARVYKCWQKAGATGARNDDGNNLKQHWSRTSWPGSKWDLMFHRIFLPILFATFLVILFWNRKDIEKRVSRFTASQSESDWNTLQIENLRKIKCCILKCDILLKVHCYIAWKVHKICNM